MLRRPVDQAVSNYLHVLSDPENPLHASASRQSFSAYLRENVDQIHYQASALCVAMSSDPATHNPARPGTLDGLLAFLDSLPFVGVIERAEQCCEVLSRVMSLDGTLELPALNTAVYRGISTRTLERLRAEYQNLRGEPGLSYRFALEALIHAKAESRLHHLGQGSRQDSSLLSPSPMRRLVQAGFVSARRFSTLRGELAGETYVCRLTESPNHLIFGPYDRLGRGHHAVEFHFTVQSEGASKIGEIQLDVLANGETCLRKRWMRMRPEFSRRIRTLAFINPDESNVLEFRVQGRGFNGGTLVFQGITLHRAGLHQTWPSAVRRRLGRRRPGFRDAPRPL